MKKTVINKKYTHFCVSKATGNIVDAWEYPKDYDMSDIKEYYVMDMRDNDRDIKDFKLVEALPLFKKGVNPYDSANWGNN